MLPILLLLLPQAPAQPDDPVIRALSDELQRTMTLRLDGADPPYYTRYNVDDTDFRRAEASFGGVVDTTRGRSRTLSADVRAGSYELDSSNAATGASGFGGGRGGGRSSFGGGGTALPVQDDYDAIRHAVWLASDAAYKRSVEALAEKLANQPKEEAEPRPASFTPAEPVASLLPLARLGIADADWERRVEDLAAVSSLLNRHPDVVDGSVSLSAAARNRYLVSSEGARLRHGTVLIELRLAASVETPERTRLSQSLRYLALSLEELPSRAELETDFAELVATLATTAAAPRLDGYTGPVLFDGPAAAQLFEALLARGIAAQPVDPGGERRRFAGGENLERLAGKRLLPAGFRIRDDPTAATFAGTPLAGHYAFDDEGVSPRAVDLVTDGILKTMLCSRTPTAAFSGSTGHGRGGGGSVRATLGNLFIEHEDGLGDAALHQALRDAAADAGLEYGLRISALAPGMAGLSSGVSARDLRALFQQRSRGREMSALGDPLQVTKVYVDDGREEPVRGLEFDTVSVTALRDIQAAGKTPAIWNQATGTPYAIITPAILLEELDLYGIEETPPTGSDLPAPHARGR